MRYKWVLFDADGTLFDYDRAEGVALERTFEQIDCEFEPEYSSTYARVNGEVWRLFEQGKVTQKRLRTLRFEQLFEAIGIEADAEGFSVRYLRNLSECADLIDGAHDLVSTLHGEVGMIIITNGLADVQRPRFARSTIHGYFEDVVISEEVGSAKPDPAIFDEAFRRMGNPSKSEGLIVGDSLTSDIRGGSDYGIDTCWYNPDRRPRDNGESANGIDIRYEIASLDELFDIVRRTA